LNGSDAMTPLKLWYEKIGRRIIAKTNLELISSTEPCSICGGNLENEMIFLKREKEFRCGACQSLVSQDMPGMTFLFDNRKNKSLPCKYRMIGGNNQVFGAYVAESDAYLLCHTEKGKEVPDWVIPCSTSDAARIWILNRILFHADKQYVCFLSARSMHKVIHELTWSTRLYSCMPGEPLLDIEKLKSSASAILASSFDLDLLSEASNKVANRKADLASKAKKLDQWIEANTMEWLGIQPCVPYDKDIISILEATIKILELKANAPVFVNSSFDLDLLSEASNKVANRKADLASKAKKLDQWIETHSVEWSRIQPCMPHKKSFIDFLKDEISTLNTLNAAVGSTVELRHAANPRSNAASGVVW